VRPNDSALPLSQLSVSTLGVFIANSLLLCLLIACAASAGAQTRLDSSQIAPLHGDVQGAFASTILRDYNSAIDHGNGISNAIASAIQDCGLLNPCLIIVPPGYGTGEAVPGYQLSYAMPHSPATTPGNISIIDRRYGEARMLVNNNGFNGGLLNTPSGWVYDYYASAPQNAELASFYLRQWSLDGGNNQQNSSLSYADKSTWATVLSNDISHSPGQHLNLALGTQSTSLGNTMGLNNLVTCYGGFNAQGDLGCHAMDNLIAQGTVEYGGTLTGTPFLGATLLSVSATQGAYTQGTGRFLARVNAGTISAGTISNITNNFAAATVVTGAATAWPVSNVIGQLGTNVTAPGIASVTPSNFMAGSLAAIGVASLVCVSDQGSFEMIYPTSVSGTTLTANFAKVHPGNAVISSGGLCGYLLDLTADDVTNSTFPTKSQTITGTLHFAWPVIASTSATSAAVWVTGDGGWQSLTSRWNASTANGYKLYPFAEVVSTQQNGIVSNTLTVGPNAAAWAAGDTVYEFIYPSVHQTFGNTIIESYYPNISGANGFSLQYNLPLQGTEAMMTLANNAPASFYRSNGGAYSPPDAIHLAGPTSRTLTVDQPGDSATVAVGCSAPCTSTPSIFAAGNAAYYDFLIYDQSNKHWNMSAGSNATHYNWAANQFITPFSNTSFTADASAAGYVATRQVRSSTSSNSDVSGELVFSNAASVSQPLQGTYASHPECIARPEFDEGSTNRYWVSYSTSAFTVTFAAAVTGVVSYACIGRN